MAELINFESSWEKSSQREQTKKAREKILEKAKYKFEREQKKEEDAKLRGEDTWMLTSVNDRILNEEKSFEKSKKKKKKEKKKKKDKKKKKKKDQTSSDSESESEPEWVEKPIQPDPVIRGPIGPKLERAEWMMASFDINALSTISRADLRAKKEKENEEKRAKEELLNKPGRHERELNPYWKDEGTGLPEEHSNNASKQSTSVIAGDGGVSWLRKAYERCEQQAEDENRSLEEVAAEKYGSLKKLKTMLKDAEDKFAESRTERKYLQSKERVVKSCHSQQKMFMRPSSPSNSTSRIEKNKSKDTRYSNYKSDKRSSSVSSSSSDSENDRYKRKPQPRERSRSRERKYYSRNKSRSRDRKHDYEDRLKKQREKSRERSNDRRYQSRQRSRSRSRERKSSNDNYFRKSNSANSKSLSSKFKKPGSDSDKDDECSYSKSNQFRKPEECDSDGKTKYSNYISSKSSLRKYNSQPAWKKKEFLKPNDDNENSGAKKPMKKNSPVLQVSADSSSSSSSSEDDSDSQEQTKAPSPIKVLSEQEMNQLGAKILKAEIMGNQTLADELKAQLSVAQASKKGSKSFQSGSVSGTKADQDKEKAENDSHVVILTKTNKKGMVRPLAEREHPIEPKQGRRKKQKIETHTGGKGERSHYFHDDDKFDLKSLVEQEKMGTAEDSNMMFARLAGRSSAKTDDDWQVDDMLLDKASKKVSDSKAEEKDRYTAILEHRKIAKGMEKCQFCFDKVPKHLIIAIGTKCYLCLPNHKSLTEGHCLIVPMQHVTQGTTVDEDVWDEIQVFRKSLTKMFDERDEDCVFMEMSRNLNYHPHMYIDCIPMEKEVGDMAPIYFKKAIMESESEWAQNKKLVDLSQKNVRHSVPKGFPYFSVDFGLQGGFAHIIEDEKEFPPYFGREIVGGMIDAGPELWRKPRKENFDDQRKKVLSFAEVWKPYDWTQTLTSQGEEKESS